MSAHPPYAGHGFSYSQPRAAQPRSFTDYKNENLIGLSKALAANNLAAIDNFVSRYEASGPPTGRYSRTVHMVNPILSDAIEMDNAEFAESLLERGMCVDHSYFRQALEVHAMHCLDLFLRRGYDVNKAEAPTAPRGADLNAHALCDTTTPMSIAVQSGTPELVRELLEDPRDLVDVGQGDLLHYALARKTDIVPVLAMLLDHGAPINASLYSHLLGAQNMFCFMPRGPPLHKAADDGNLEAVRFLLSRNADVSIRDTQGKTALYYAQNGVHADIVEVLQTATAEFKPTWTTAASPSSPHHRHQTSLEQVIDMSTAQEPLGHVERTMARATFYHIVEHFEQPDPYNTASRATRHTLYSQPRLVRYTYEFARSAESQDIFLRSFFGAVGLDLTVDVANLNFDELLPLFSAFAEYLMDHFFFPLKASTRKTPQPSPAIHSAVLRAQGATDRVNAYIGTEERLATIRAQCLTRDRYRCIISHQDSLEFDTLEVAHILPHSLMKTSTGVEMDASCQAVLAVLNMFDHGVVHMINGIDIDRPRNGLTLSHMMHNCFGSFRLYFEAVDNQYNTYRILSFKAADDRALRLPVTRTLFATEDRTIDPPSPRLLALHRAIAHILHLSGAGAYIDWIFRDTEERAVRADGSSALGRMVSLGLGGWLDNTICS
ncbi:Ankyrin repeat-containing domain protein [Niveomyces insectorum RCEF 264]|uniref:Ankyrin repeat-containing domain protein n=1 Tax=Niveomyces insectorum RCEF 264 TaxID=1081102 RepID=A0A167W3D4_9HYPO|nr:Ankyrin repeat-containing domain protein [Niveomyces insectorum RCEF 264]